jgi:hypothetical protein
MSNFSVFIPLYTTAILLVLVGYLLYLQFSSLHWEESEIRLLERLELHLAHILRVLEAPDVKMLFKNPDSRQRLFLEFSSDLKEDVVGLWRSRRLEWTTLALVASFFFFYYGMRVKAYVSCGRNDIRFLTGLELALFRKLREAESR